MCSLFKTFPPMPSKKSHKHGQNTKAYKDIRPRRIRFPVAIALINANHYDYPIDDFRKFNNTIHLSTKY